MTTWVAGIWARTANVPPLLRRRPAGVSVPPSTKHDLVPFVFVKTSSAGTSKRHSCCHDCLAGKRGHFVFEFAYSTLDTNSKQTLGTMQEQHSVILLLHYS